MTARQVIICFALLSVVLPAMVLTNLAHPLVSAVPDRPLFTGATLDHRTRALFQRACQNCHSDNTQWPWYSRVSPVHFIIAKDIENARRHVNFSNWESYPPARKRDLLARIGSLARTAQMPLPRYIWLHPEAVLSSSERQQIYDWTRAERKRLRQDSTIPFQLK